MPPEYGVPLPQPEELPGPMAATVRDFAPTPPALTRWRCSATSGGAESGDGGSRIGTIPGAMAGSRRQPGRFGVRRLKRAARRGEDYIAGYTFPPHLEQRLGRKIPELDEQSWPLVEQGLREWFDLLRLAGEADPRDAVAGGR